METLVQEQTVTPNRQTNISAMPVPEPHLASQNRDASSQPFAAGLKPHLIYKCRLTQLAQKLRKPRPVYQTQNEGSDHQPRFRTTIWIDDVSYTSQSTFPLRKMAEMDASEAAYIAIIQKLKSDAFQFIREDKKISKSVLAEYGAKFNLGKPEYATNQVGSLVPVFSSSVVFSGVTYVGGNGKTKKEAEQLAARAAILSYLESKSGNDMAEIINCKSRLFVEMNKIHETNNAHNVNKFLGAQTGVDHGLDLTEAKPESGINTMGKPCAALPVVAQPPVPTITPAVPIVAQPPVPTITPAVPIVVQPPVPTITPVVPVVTQPTIPQASIEPITPDVVTQSPVPTISTAVPLVAQPPVPTISPAVPVIAQPPVPTITPAVPVVTQPPVPTITPAVPVISQPPVPTVSHSLANVPTTDLSSNVMQPANSEVAAQTLEYIPLMGTKSERKRNRRNKKSAQKKMRVDAEMPVVPASQVPPLSSQ